MLEKYITDEEVRKKLKELHESKYELKNIFDSQDNKNSFVIDLCGLPRTGKTNTVSKLLTFFRKANFKVLSTKEPAEIIKETEDSKLLTDKEFNDKTFDISKHQLEFLLDKKPDIIIQDRGIFDNFIWYQMMYDKGELSDHEYNRIIELLQTVLLIDNVIYILVGDSLEIVKRDYNYEITLEDRKKTTEENINNLRKSIDSLLQKIQNKDNIRIIDTTNINERDMSIKIAEDIINTMKKKYIKNHGIGLK